MYAVESYNNNNIFLYNAALSDDVHMPAFIPLCSVFGLLPFASILNMVCIDLFLHQLKVILWVLE